MVRDFDVDRQLQADAARVRRLNQKGISDLSIGGVMESVFWLFALLSAIGMVAVMPWVGPAKPIPGTVWLGFSLTSVLLFGGLALATRMVKAAGDDIDRGMDKRFRTERGR